jgi:hypothetical protein
MAGKNFKPLNDTLAKVIEIQKRAQQRTPTKEPKQLPPQMALDLWPESVRGVPNAVLRGSLFSVSNRRAVCKQRELLAEVDGIEVRFKGERFNQTDLDVWEMLLHLARLHPLGDRVEFSAHAFLKALGRGISGKHHDELKEQFARLLGGVIEITWTKEGKTFAGTFVAEFYRDEETQRYVVVFSRKMLGLYEGGYSYIDWSQRQALGNNSLAKWLHGFYATHAAPFPYKVETIKNLCGSTAGELKTFRQKLKKALDELLNAGSILAWRIDDNDLVYVEKIPSLTQQRNLRRTKK